VAAIPKRVVGINYPRLAHLAGVQGKVVLTARVLVGGSVGELRIISGDAVLAKAAKESLSRWLFSGCKSSSSCEARINFAFVLNGECDIANCPSEVQIDLPDSVTISSKMPRAILN
jgi:outer membrane biosynthesis protein TonB